MAKFINPFVNEGFKRIYRHEDISDDFRTDVALMDETFKGIANR